MRTCDTCNCKMNEGYYVEPCEYYCSDTCLHEMYTEEQYEYMYDNDIAFWTDWEDEEEE